MGQRAGYREELTLQLESEGILGAQLPPPTGASAFSTALSRLDAAHTHSGGWSSLMKPGTRQGRGNMCSVKERESEATKAGVYPKGAFTGGEARHGGGGHSTRPGWWRGGLPAVLPALSPLHLRCADLLDLLHMMLPVPGGRAARRGP